MLLQLRNQAAKAMSPGRRPNLNLTLRSSQAYPMRIMTSPTQMSFQTEAATTAASSFWNDGTNGTGYPALNCKLFKKSNLDYSNRDQCTSKTKKILTLFISLLTLVMSARAELPTPRLHSIFPSGGQSGTTIQVTVEGTDLDDARSIHFSNPGITSERNPTNAAAFSVTISSNVPLGTFDARVIGRFGISNPRFFTVDDRTNLVAKNNHTLESAINLPMESTVNAFATAAAADFYKLEASEPILISCQAEPFDSKMKPALILYDAEDREILRDRREGRILLTPAASGLYTVKVHDLQFRGGKQFPYRLTVTTKINLDLPARLARLPAHHVDSSSILSEQESNDHTAQKITPPCEIRGQFFPEHDVDCFQFGAKKGDVFWLEVVSDRVGQPTDPFLLVQRLGDKETDISEFYSFDANLGGPIFNTASRDPTGRLEIKEDGAYRIQLRDLFNIRADPRRSYRLSIRPETPDFDLIALIAPPPTFEKDKREAQIWSSSLRRNETILIKVVAVRRDNFSGEISLRVDGLPEGLQASESVISEGQTAAWLSITSNDKTMETAAPIQIIGKAKSGARELERSAHPTSVLWDVPDYNNESVRSRLTQQLILSAITEPTPLTVEPKQTSWQVPQATTLSIPIHFSRSADFKQPLKLRAYLDNQNDPFKEWQIDGNTSDSTFDLDVKAAKLSNGQHQLFFLAQTSGKIRRVRADEVAALEAEAKQAESKKDEAKKKEIDSRVQLRDVTAIFSSPIVKIFVNPAPTASK
jgi:hypothetical protein